MECRLRLDRGEGVVLVGGVEEERVVMVEEDEVVVVMRLEQMGIRNDICAVGERLTMV